MEMVADMFLVAGALGAGLYCFVLARRLNKFNDLEKGVGGAVAVLSAQVDDLTRTLAAAQKASQDSGAALDEMTERAEAAAKRLELMIASLHDLPAEAAAPEKHTEAEPVPEPLSTQPMFTRHPRTMNGEER